MKKFLVMFLLTLILPIASFSGAQLDPVMLKNAVDASVKVEGVKLDEYELFDQDGKAFKLGEYFKDGKPLVISFIYTSCPQVCPTITAEFKKAVEGARVKFGDRFNALTIGFDPENDTAASLKGYGAKFTDDFKSFRFASGDADTIERLTGQVGFFHVRLDDGSFDHIDMVTTVKADGTVYRQVYSLRTQSQNLGSRLDELITGKAAGESRLTLVDKLKFFCYRYDPYTGQYVIDYPVFVSIFIQVLVIGVIIYAVWGKKILGRIRKPKEGRG